MGHSDPIPTSKKIAEQTHVSEPTIKRDAQFARAIDEIRDTEPEFVQKVLVIQKVFLRVLQLVLMRDNVDGIWKLILFNNECNQNQTLILAS
jgi:hypothetical protein